jgi:hypothetical protein
MAAKSSQQANESTQDIEQPRRKSRWMTAVSAIWLFGFPEFLSFLPSPADNPPVWFVLAGIAGGLFWIVSAYWIYDTLFNKAEARWPAAKGIREILSPLLKGFLFPHHK